MTEKDGRRVSRRFFLKTVGAAGIGSLVSHLTPSSNAAAQEEKGPESVPRRTFGRTGVEVPILSLGGMFDTPNNQLLLKQAIRWGVAYWDTASSYGGGRSEEGIGKYLSRFPEDRRKIFLVTKSGAYTNRGRTRDLERSLERMQTDAIDLFFIHGVSSIREMDGDVKQWGEKAKASGKIRWFGFSTHSNMEACLRDAAELGWIDGIMTTYNYRLMHTDPMRRAVDACVRAGIGLTAMKTQGGGQVKTNTGSELELAGRFLEKGFTDGQAKLMAVWEDPHIASICSQMPNLTLLMSNVAAAVHKTRLSATERNLLQVVAAETESVYCAGCTQVCEPALPVEVPIGDIMRHLMYSRSYGDLERARAEFRDLPAGVRRRLTTLDYSPAEARCPHRVAIGRLIRQAVKELA